MSHKDSVTISVESNNEESDLEDVDAGMEHDGPILELEDADIPPQIVDEKGKVKKKGKTEVDGKHSYASKKNVAEGMMDIALLTANANQLRFLITYNLESKTFYISVVLILVSLVLQVSVGIMLIFKRQMKNRGKQHKISRTNDFLVGGVFMITVINVFVASFTTTESPKSN